MKTLAALPLAAVLALGLAGAAQAWVAPESRAAHESVPAAPTSVHAEHPYAPACIGLSAGTAHPGCGTATGGPVGGLH